MGNKVTSQSEEEPEPPTPTPHGTRVPSLTVHTPSGRSPGAAYENGDDGEIDVELPCIPKMEIFSHPIAAAHAATPGGSLPTPPHLPHTVRGEEHTLANLPPSEQHESCEWQNPSEGSACLDRSSSPFDTTPSAILDSLSLECHETPSSPGPSSHPYMDDSSPTKCENESKEQRELRWRDFVIKELIETERAYVKDLADIVQDYLAEMRNPESDMRIPDDLKDGKDKIVFGNLQAIYEWHRDHFLKNTEDFLEHPENIGPVFQRSEKKFQMYVKYCQNKPKSEYIVSEYADYFEELRQKFGHKLQLPDLLIKPVQRLMKYQLLLRDILKHTDRAGLREHIPSIRRALHIMTVVPKSADDMMNVGRLQGFEGKIMAQGKLLLYGPLLCSEGDSLVNFKPKELIVFLFEQSIIFSESEGKKKQFTNQEYHYKNHLQTNKMQMIERFDSSDPLKFLLKSTDPNPGKADVAFVCLGAHEKDKEEWVSLIRHLLQAQKDFLKAIQSPIAYQKEKTKNLESWLVSYDGSSLPPENDFGVPPTHPSPLRTTQSDAQHKEMLEVPDTHRRQSDPTFDAPQQTGSHMNTKPDASFSPGKGRRHFFRLPLKSKIRSDRRLSEAWNGSDGGIHPKGVSSPPPLPPNSERSPLKEDRLSIEAGMMVKVLEDFVAVREDEISLSRGEVIQVLSCNSVRGFLVHRAATSTCPAAEGWVPSQVLLPPANSHYPYPTSQSPVHSSSSKKAWIKLRKSSLSSTDPQTKEITLPPDRNSPGYSLPAQKRVVALINPYHPETTSGGPPPHPDHRYFVPDSPDSPIKFVRPLNNVVAPPGNPVEMSCKASGQGILAGTINVRWYGPSGELTDPRFEMEQHRDGTFHLHFASARVDDAGEYTCVISTGIFSVSCSALLRIVK